MSCEMPTTDCRECPYFMDCVTYESPKIKKDILFWKT